MAYSTRVYSNKQETQVARNLKGRKVPNSGAPLFCAGDVKTKKFCIECKTATTEKKSFGIKKEWIVKAQEEARSQGLPYWSLAFNFGGENQKENLYIINEPLFKELLQYLED